MNKILCSIIICTLWVIGIRKNQPLIRTAKLEVRRPAKTCYQELIISDQKIISRVTGRSLPDEHFPNPNKTHERFDVVGTDLGICWAINTNETGLFFGDTFGGDWKPENRNTGKSNWRSNVLAFSKDNNLEDGLTFDQMLTDKNGHAEQIIFSKHDVSGSGSFTAIPTAAIRVRGIDYVHYMDVRKWETPGKWKTNFSALYKSTNSGRDWKKCTDVVFDSTSNFSQVAYAKRAGFVYMLGTGAGRFGAAYLARFAEKNILNQNQYEYLNHKHEWVKGRESNAAPIFGPSVGELSLIFNSTYKRWIVTYLNEQKHQIIYRNAPTITGEWSEEKVLVDLKEYPGAYGGFIHPKSEKGSNLYFLMSQWNPYNVFLMKGGISIKKNPENN